VWKALREGVLVRPEACEQCGKRSPVHGHHGDYSRPLDVEWLCPACHSRHHAQERTERWREQRRELEQNYVKPPSQAKIERIGSRFLVKSRYGYR